MANERHDPDDNILRAQITDGLGNPVSVTNGKLDVNATGGGGVDPVGLKNAAGTTINPATSDKQLPDNHQVTVSNPFSGAVTGTVSVSNSDFPLPAAQVVTLTPPAAITGFATSAKQLPDNHQVSVSNMIPAVETGLATSAKQTQPGVDIGDVTINNATGAGAVPIQDGGNSITVDGTVSANATLSAETTKVIGTVRLKDANGNNILIGSNGGLGVEPVVGAIFNIQGGVSLNSGGTVNTFIDPNSALSERATNTNGVSTPLSTFGVGNRNYITNITVYNSSATSGYVDIRDGTAGAVIYTIPLPAGGGAVVSFPTPLRQPTLNTALAFQVSAAITTVYLSFNGFKLF